MDIIAGMSFVCNCHNKSCTDARHMTTLTALRGCFMVMSEINESPVTSVGRITEGVRAGVSFSVTGRSLLSWLGLCLWPRVDAVTSGRGVKSTTVKPLFY